MMMFLQEDDYKIVCGEAELDVLTQSDPSIRQKAERVAMEEVASYLRPRYDTAKAFAAEDNERNNMLLQVTANIALYYLAHWLPQRMSLDGRQELYDGAIAWLTKVSKGGAMPDLPTYTDSSGTSDATNPMRYGSMPASKYDY